MIIKYWSKGSETTLPYTGIEAWTTCTGLEALRHGLQAPGGATLLAELLVRSPDLHELLRIWEAQLTVTLALLLSCTTCSGNVEYGNGSLR